MILELEMSRCVTNSDAGAGADKESVACFRVSSRFPSLNHHASFICQFVPDPATNVTEAKRGAFGRKLRFPMLGGLTSDLL